MKFQVIQGGLSAPTQAEKQRPAAHNTSSEIEADRLRKAILALTIHDAGLTVEQALDEACRLLHAEEIENIERGSFMLAELEKIGLRFQLANPELELARGDSSRSCGRSGFSPRTPSWRVCTPWRTPS